MSVGGGKSTSNERTSSMGEAWGMGQGENVNFGQQGGYNFGSGTSSSQNQSSSQSGSFVDPNQQGYLDDLRANAQTAFDQSQGALGGFNQGLMDTGQAALGNLQGLGNTQQVIDSQLVGLRSGLDDIYSKGINQIGGQATSAGAFGGSRHALQEAALGGEIGKAYTQGFGDIVSNASNQAITANNAAIGALSPLYNLGMGTQFGALGALQGLLGDPTVLQQSTSNSTGTSTSQDQSGGASFGQDFGYGYDYNENYAYDQSQGRANSDKADFNLGFPPK